MNSENNSRSLSFSDPQVFYLFEIQILDSPVKLEIIPEVISNSKIFSCEKCCKLFSSQKKLDRHVQKLRENLNKETFDERSRTLI